MVGTCHIFNRSCPDFSPFSAMMGNLATGTGGGSGSRGAGPARPHLNI
jgi:hypothetical protein